MGDFPRDEEGTCAFCHGDPCAETSPPDSAIARYYRENPRAETCPTCAGQPT
jgi:hypothetical protein